MLETITFHDSDISKSEYKEQFDQLISRLIVLQQEAKKKDIGMVVLFEGWKGAGKGSRISDLIYHLDARDTSVYVTEDFHDDEARLVRDPSFGATGYFPMMQQFWKALGPRGSMTFYDRGWYSVVAQHLINAAPRKKTSVTKRYAAMVEESMDRVMPMMESFEKQLIADGYLVVKFFLHIDQETQRTRLNDLYNDPQTFWRVSDRDLAQVDRYEQMYKLYDEMLENSNFGSAEWVVLEAAEKRRVNLQVVKTLVEVLEKELNKPVDEETLAAEKKAQKNSASGVDEANLLDERFRSAEENARLLAQAQQQAQELSAVAPKESRFPIVKDYPRLEEVDHTLHYEKREYKKMLKAEQEKLRRLELDMYIKRVPMIIMYEGWDAAGKGGSIKRVAQALDARSYTIFPSPAPSRIELAHPHLWRYWTRLPKAGHVGIYDRSWYGRVLVERVEGFASVSQWSRAYDEINEFERDLTNWGAILLKFWVDISPETQLERFRAREENPEKRWKITAEDWRNRDKNPQYYAAIEDMFRLTSTEFAPWYILESDNKYYARIKALRIINEALEDRLNSF